MLRITVVIEPCDKGGFSAHVPVFPGCFGEGETLEETLADIREAIELYAGAFEDDLVIEKGAQIIELEWKD
jgi:predicted RNase H-like HicB family nuclease